MRWHGGCPSIPPPLHHSLHKKECTRLDVGRAVKRSIQTGDAEQMIDEVVNIALRAGVLNGDLQIEPYLDCSRSR